MAFLKKHLKSIVLWTSIFLLSDTTIALISNEWSGWRTSLFGSLTAGTCVYVVLAMTHYYKLKQMNVDIKELTRDDLLTFQTRIINTTYSRKEVIKKTEKFFLKKPVQVSENMIVIKTFSWYGWNKTIVEFLKENQNLQLKITSKPILPTTFFDYSENLKTVRNLKKILIQ